MTLQSLLVFLLLSVGLRLGLNLSLDLSLQQSNLPLSPLPAHGFYHAHTCQLLINLLLVNRDFVRLLGSRPEVPDVKAVVEVRAEVVHPTDGEEDVHAELEYRRVVS